MCVGGRASIAGGSPLGSRGGEAIGAGRSLGLAIHQEADRAAMHSVDRLIAVMLRCRVSKHEAIAAERHDHVGRLLGQTSP